jgi:hypothetical protein
VTDRAHVHVGLGALELSLGHGFLPLNDLLDTVDGPGIARPAITSSW